MLFREHVLDVRQYFSDIGIWGKALTLNPRGWLENFDEVDRDLAVHLLNGFIYLNDEMVDKLFETGFRRIGSSELNEGSAKCTFSRWKTIRDSALVSYPMTHPTDSGHLFLREISTKFAIPEERIFTLSDLTNQLSQESTSRPIVIVDDFTGTGDQFIRTITATPAGGGPSLVEELNRLYISDAYFIVAVATDTAKQRIESNTPFVVSAGNVLPETASILSSNSHLVPAGHRTDIIELVKRYSGRANIEPSKMWGYKDSGLAISFAHKTPNNTLQIFRQEDAGWTPLIQK